MQSPPSEALIHPGRHSHPLLHVKVGQGGLSGSKHVGGHGFSHSVMTSEGPQTGSKIKSLGLEKVNIGHIEENREKKP